MENNEDLSKLSKDEAKYLSKTLSKNLTILKLEKERSLKNVKVQKFRMISNQIGIKRLRLIPQIGNFTLFHYIFFTHFLKLCILFMAMNTFRKKFQIIYTPAGFSHIDDALDHSAYYGIVFLEFLC